MKEMNESTFEKWLENTKASAKEAMLYRHTPGEAAKEFVNKVITAFNGEAVARHAALQVFRMSDEESMVYFTARGTYRRDEFDGQSVVTASYVTAEVADYIASEFLKETSLEPMVRNHVFEISRIHNEAEDNILITTPKKYVSMNVLERNIRISSADVIYDLSYLRSMGVETDIDFLNEKRFTIEETDEGTRYTAKAMDLTFLLKDFEAQGQTQLAPCFQLYQKYKTLKESLF